jgi:hypothetical protein
LTEYISYFVTEEGGGWILETGCEGEDSVSSTEVAEPEHGAVALEEREGLVV